MLRSTGLILKPQVHSLINRTAMRSMATEKSVRDRIASTKSISKITSSMKMVAVAKLKKQQARLDQGEAFGRLFTDAVHPVHDMENIDITNFSGKKHMFILITSDRGLCGGVNSNVIKQVTAQAKELQAAGKDFSVYCVGDKGIGRIEKEFPDNFVGFTKNCYPKEGLTFPQASAIAARITGNEFDTASVCFNYFRSAIKYDTVTRLLAPMFKSPEHMANNPEIKDFTESHLKAYDVEPDDKKEVLDNMFNFSIATTVYGCMLQNVVSEMSARMNAMESASGNADDMILTLSRQYNRMRQARITTELIEIISGAESLKTAD